MGSFDVIIVGAGPAGVASAIKCTRHGLSTLLLEKEFPGRHKPCGGITPTVSNDLLEDEFGLKLPREVMSAPETLGLFYVPPSGRANGGDLRNYRLFNLDRDRFDRWLCETAEGLGVKVLYGVQFLEFRRSEMISVTVKEKDGITELKSRYLIGADGVHSKVRKQLYPTIDWKILKVIQEHWRANGDFGEYFYMFLRGEITPSYAYLIPKNGLFIIGTGTPMKYPASMQTCLGRFKELLTRQFDFQPLSLERKEVGIIPYRSPLTGKGNVILAGDAAGFCNSFSGEGIRLAIESGIAASEAITQAEQSGNRLSALYAKQVKGLSEFIRRTHRFSISLTDGKRETFVGTQVRRPDKTESSARKAEP